MKGNQIVRGEYRGREAAALFVNGQLDDLLLDSDAPRRGTIYRARATRPVKGQGGMFFDTPDGSAFMRGAKGIAPGSFHLVQVTGYAEAGKAIPVTGRLIWKSRFAIATPGAPGVNVSRQIRDEDTRVALLDAAHGVADAFEDCGVVLRSAAAHAELNAVTSDVSHVCNVISVVLADGGDKVEKLLEGASPHELAERDWPDGSVISQSFDDVIDLARSDVFPIGNGGSMAVEPTRACIAVDVNTGPDMSPSAGLKANIAAARDLPRLLRIKGLGGQIVVDFAPMSKRDRRAVESALRTAFRADEIESALVDWTPMGHFEINRKRARVPLHEILG